VFQRILLAVDEGDEASEAVAATAALARAFKSEVTVLHVRERTVTAVGVIEKESIPESFALGEAVAARLAGDGVQASAAIVAAEPRHVAREILRRADATDADLIVIGGLSSLVQQARCPVLVIPTSH
jgi:nucleotide-binding universal stress UspA family protein